MIASHLLGRPVVLRELMPQDLKIEIAQFTGAEAVRAAHFLAYVVGLAHGRQLEPKQRRAWRDELMRRQDEALDAPSWLWEAVVSLAASHEAGYLEHCRIYALDGGAQR